MKKITQNQLSKKCHIVTSCENKQTARKTQKTVMDSESDETTLDQHDELTKQATKFKVSVSLDPRSNNETTELYNITMSSDIASTSSASTSDGILDNSSDSINFSSPLCVSSPSNSKSEAKDMKHEIQQSRYLSMNNKEKYNRITSAEGSKQNSVQVNTDAKEKENKENEETTEANKSSMESTQNKYYTQQYKDNSKEIKNNIMKKTNQKAKKKKKKPAFSDYIPVPIMKKILHEQSSINVQFIKGNLRVNPVSSKFAYLHMNDTEVRDLLIVGTHHRNRAFDGDLVVANINPEKLWFKFPDGTIQKTGTIVCILEKFHPRTAVGHLKNHNSLVLCYPRDQRIPVINIYLESLPSSYRERPELYENMMFYVKIDSWEENTYASGRVLSIVGENGEMQAEIQAILLENNLNISPYQEELLKELPNSDVLTDDDIRDREDWRNECVFSIDPSTAVDIDDLLSCKVLENGNYEIGVHISDVTHYLKAFSLLDIEVSKRGTSVYMPHMVYHMLPKELCEICSLYPGKDRLAFSIIWEMTPDAEVVQHRFAKTVVRSCCQMSYDVAQIMIDNPKKSWPEDFLDIRGNYTISMLHDIINKLFTLASKMQNKRFDNGALMLDQPKLQLRFGTIDTREHKIPMPINYSVYERKDSHSLVEEFMLLANTTTAVRLHTAIPETAFLRIHKSPFKYPLNALCETLQKYGIHLNIETAGTLHASIHRYAPNSPFQVDDPLQYIMLVIINLCSKTMTRAEYICASTIPSCDTTHYALNVPFYTHFTSPIRRYSDCVVHRLLSAVIENKPLPEKWTAKLCSRIAAKCNVTKYNAKLVQEQSIEIFFAEMVGLAGGYESLAIVWNVKEENLDIILCETGIKLRVDLKEIADIATTSYTLDVIPTVTINWKESSIDQVIGMFSFVRVRVEKIDMTLRLKAILLPLLH